MIRTFERRAAAFLPVILAAMLAVCPGCSPSPSGADRAEEEEIIEISLLPEDPTVTDSAQASAPASALPHAATPEPPQARAKNVILFIADGAGYGSFTIAADFQTGSPTGLPYQREPWESVLCATFHRKSFYDPARDWADFPNVGTAFYERPAEFIPPDSASTATAMNTGVKTRNGRIAYGPNDERLTTLAELAHAAGLTTGVVTSLQIASATPAAVAAHELERKAGQALFDEMLFGGDLDILIGAGHPEYGDDGQPVPARFLKYGPSEGTWKRIRAGDLPDGWTFIESRDDFQKIARGDVPVPRKVLGMPRVNASFQFDRPQGAPRLETVPTLAECAEAALRVAQQNPRGFYLMIEGGAVDSANHANNLPRMLEEMREFNDAVACACRWVERHSSWEETLIIVTSDHDNGALFGPELDPDGAPTPIRYRGRGQLPEARYYAMDHTKHLVPVYARGPGADYFRSQCVGTDATAARLWSRDGAYVDQTSIFHAMRRALGL